MQYNKYRLVECTDYKVMYGIILLNKKHKVEEFQQAICDVKEDFFKEGFYDWTITDVLQDDIFNDFDFKYMPISEAKTIEI